MRDDLNRRAQAQEPLPDLVINGYYLLGKDWLETARNWKEAGFGTPPVMITVANRTETAARVNHAFTQGRIRIDELQAPDRTLHIDSKVLSKAEAREEAAELESPPTDGDEDGDEEAPSKKLSKKDQAEQLRQVVDTVGQVGTHGRPARRLSWTAIRTWRHGLRTTTSASTCITSSRGLSTSTGPTS